MIIPDDYTLRKFLPNTFTPAIGEQPLFEKIEPFIISAEKWFESNFMPAEIIEQHIDLATTQEEKFYFLPRRIVALKAWLHAIPAIDIVVTANGIGVIETNTLKPASKFKIERLAEAVSAELDQCLDQLIKALPELHEWPDSPQGQYFASTLFPDFGILRTQGIRLDLWEEYTSLIPKITDIESEFADLWISHEIMARLRRAIITRTTNRHEAFVASKIKAAVRCRLSSLHPPLDANIKKSETRNLEEANAYIRQHDREFPEWRHSSTHKFFSTPNFKNKPGSTAYFF